MGSSEKSPVGAGAAENLAWLRLSRSRNVGPATFRRLLSGYGSAARALEALPDLAGRGGAKRYQVCSADQAAREIAAAEAAGAKLLRLDRAEYPSQLAAIPDPPPFLWAIGEVGLLNRAAVAIVGARNASALGLRLARALGRGLGEANMIVVSGLARGIDKAAHEAAEAPMGLEPQARHFPRRNRIIAGLSSAVVLIEAAERSGSLITARFALEQGREVMAAPGSPLDPRSGGCNAMIRQGAALVRSAEDVLEALETPRQFGLQEPAALPYQQNAWTPDEEAAKSLRAEVERLLGGAPVEEDEIARLTGAPAGALAQTFLELELAGRLDRRAGGLIALAPPG
jgi:DNA processing protein